MAKVQAKKVVAGSGNKLVVVLVRGLIDLSKDVKDTLAMLRMFRKNHAVIVDNTPTMKGMVVKVKDCVTWGEIDDATVKELVEKRGELFLSRKTDVKKKYKYAIFSFNGKDYKPYFRLNPPRKGFGRKGIKVPFKVGGGLGYRGEKINDLIKRML
ncbi:50S ribosomal protein L30 [Candidatus Woesearchaeota archaeon]|nr:50S ribosomal protein L30 [Candidatus Woesearchaeota archaeon]